MSTNKITLYASRKSYLTWAGLIAAGLALAITAVKWSGSSVGTTTASAPAHAESNELVRAFSGTQPDGAMTSNGQDLVLSPALIRRFEYHLTAVGERTQTQIKAAILKDIAAELNEKGQKEASRLLDAYLKFKTALGSVQQPRMTEITGPILAQHFKAVRDLRAQYFQPDEVRALFGNVDDYDDYTVRKLSIVQDKGLSATEREAQLQQLKNTLSPENRANVEQPVIHLTLAAQEEQARREGATPADIQQLRTKLVGADAASRLEVLDREQAAWKARIQQYQSARAQDPARAEQLKNTLFTPQEQLRLAAYE